MNVFVYVPLCCALLFNHFPSEVNSYHRFLFDTFKEDYPLICESVDCVKIFTVSDSVLSALPFIALHQMPFRRTLKIENLLSTWEVFQTA